MGTELWHPFADMGAVEPRRRARPGPRRRVPASGTTPAARYLDATAGLWFANVGHGRREIARGDRASRPTGWPRTRPSATGQRPALALAERVAALAPVRRQQGLLHLRRLRLGRHRGQDGAPVRDLVGHPERRVVVVRDKAYHGMHLAGTALAGIDDNQAGYGDLDADVRAGPVGRRGRARRDARRARRRPRRRVLLRAGHRRRRRLRGRAGLPARTCARSAGSAVSCSSPTRSSPASAGSATGSRSIRLRPRARTCCCAPRASPPATSRWVRSSPRRRWPSRSGREPGGTVWRHGYTYSGHAVAAAAGLAPLWPSPSASSLPERALDLEKILADALAPLAQLPAVAEVRAGTGVLAAVQLTRPGDRRARGPRAARSRCADAGPRRRRAADLAAAGDHRRRGRRARRPRSTPHSPDLRVR